jgi:valyl-tRNA synthetase
MLPKAYSAADVEKRIYAAWEESGAFQPGGDPAKEAFCIIMPPPNANGELHVGHAMYVVEDILTRWRRMLGHPTLWMPGTDHAGIETQVVFERKLEKEGRSRFDLGPEKFYDEVMRFTRANQTNILSQMRSMGFSADWSKTKFTLDPDVIDIVYDTFIQLDREGLVYRGNRVCNWCPRCQTSFADIEIKHVEEDGVLYTLDYGSVRIATTRPETIFADTAVAVNPKDARYSNLVGSQAVVPLLKRSVPIIADDHVDPSFGTGALKVTPAHDFNDFEIGMRHKLPSPSVIDKEGRMINVPEGLEGLVTAEARKKTVEMLRAEGTLLGEEPMRHAVARCERCGTVIEPLPTDQWYVKVDGLKKRAKESIERGDIRIIPERFTQQCIDWLDQMYDWNISRQIWWGIRMPVYYPLEAIAGKKDYLLAKTEDEAVAYYGKGNYRAETDTFDTWFSSSQWPHATLQTNGLLDRFYPTSVMETGRDILFKWVARMIMLGLYKMEKVPFRCVYLHGMVRDEKGQKMSKSKGNVINPLEMTAEFGTDALRIALIIGVTPGNDGSLSVEKVKGYKNFVNKLWNASRFVLMKCEEMKVEPSSITELPAPADLSLADRAILHASKELVADVTKGLEEYRLSEVGERLYAFVWEYFCDWYLELSKGTANPAVLVHVLRRILRLLHPYCPFVTEELWASVKPADAGMLISEAWPAAKEARKDADAFAQLQVVIDVISAVRKMRSTSGIEPGKKLHLIIHTDQHLDVLQGQREHVMRLAGADQWTLDAMPVPHQNAVSTFLPGIEIHLPLEGVIDVAAERAKIEKEMQSLDAYVAATSAKLANEQFVAKAPAKVIDDLRAKLADAQEKAAKLKERLEMLG